jgi:hypothetical protein
VIVLVINVCFLDHVPALGGWKIVSFVPFDPEKK